MRTSRRFKIALGASLLFNLLVVSAIIGAIVRWQSGDLGTGRERYFVRLWTAAENLEPDNRRSYRRALRAVQQDSQALIAKARASRKATLDGLTAESFDRAATEAAMSQARAAEFEVRARVERAILDEAEKLPVVERVRLAEGLRRGGPNLSPDSVRQRDTP